MNPDERHPDDNAPGQAGQAAAPPTAPPLTHGSPDTIQPTSVFCVQCGYNLTGVAIGANCPECGRTVAPSFHSQMLPTSGRAVASLVLGICSIVGCMLYGLPSLVCGPLAIVFANQAKKQVREGKAAPSSAGMATAGLTCGVIGTALALIGIGFFAWVILMQV